MAAKTRSWDREAFEFVAERVREQALAAVEPASLVQAAVEDVQGGSLALLAIGKGAIRMTAGAESVLRNRLQFGLVVCPLGQEAKMTDKRLTAIGAEHPSPGEGSVKAGVAVEDFARRTREAMHAGDIDRCLVLISGGVSAMLCAPIGSLSVNDMRQATEILLRSGEPIESVNTVRKHLDRLKGGRLGAMLAPVPTDVLVLSDVLGNDLSSIGSGPTAGDETTFAQALEIMQRASEPDEAAGVLDALRRGAAGEFEETVRQSSGKLDHVRHRVIADNAVAVRVASAALQAMDFDVIDEQESVRGMASEVGRSLTETLRSGSGRRAVVWGGETTVDLRDGPGNEAGRGGRNLEVALAAGLEAQQLGMEPGVGIITIATDGVDGPTDAAGAAVWAEDLHDIQAARVSLARHDSYTALDDLGAVVKTGPSGTNVNDLMIAVWDACDKIERHSGHGPSGRVLGKDPV